VNRSLKGIALLLIILGIVFNEYFITRYFSYDDSISRLDIRIAIWGFQSICLVLGFGLFFLSENLNLRVKKGILNTSLFGFSVLVSLILAEIITRLISPLPNGYPTGDLLFKPDSVLGWKFIPNLKTKVNWPLESSVDIEINKNGFRDDENKDLNSIWLIGDSFVSSLEVNKNKRFTELLEAKTNLEISNFGVNGYGPVQYYLLSKELLKTHHPKHIYYLFYIRNDIYDASGVQDWIHGFSRPIIKQDSIIYPSNYLTISIEEDQKRYLKKNPIRLEDSHIYNHLQRANQSLTTTTLIPPEIGLLNTKIDSLHTLSWAATFEAFKAIQELCNKKEIPFTLILAPSPVQVETNLWKEIVASYQLKEEDYDLYLPQKKLIHYFKTNAIPYVDLTESLHSEWKKSSEPLYFKRNLHWNEHGHQLVAKALYDSLFQKKRRLN
jgi:hypothetical protein